MDPFGIRHRMPVVNEWVYLSTFEEAPLPAPSAGTVTRYIRENGRNGSAKEAPKYDAYRTSVNAVSRKVGARRPAGTFALVSKRLAIQFILDALNMSEKKEIVSSHDMFLNSSWHGTGNIRALPGYVLPEKLDEHLEDSTGLVFIRDIDTYTGVRHSLEGLYEVCQRRGALLMVDCSYTAGAFVIQAEGAFDLAVFEGNKWLLCPEGCSFAHVAKPHGVIRTKANRLMEDRYDPPPEMTMWGTRISCRILGTQNQLDIQDHILGLTNQLDGGLAEMDYELVSSRDPTKRSAMVYFKKAGVEAAKMQEMLLAEKVVSGILGECNVLSPHIFNTPEEIEKTLDILAGF